VLAALTGTELLPPGTDSFDGFSFDQEMMLDPSLFEIGHEATARFGGGMFNGW
jgi:hypothetical protein